MDFTHAPHIAAALNHWYRDNARDLPWRPHPSDWEVLTCEIMSQQTPLARVVPIWREWMERWPTPADLAQAARSEILTAWKHLGYPRRAIALHECARTIVARHGGVIPRSRADLLALPGIGPYTAAAIATFAFGQRTTVLDVNIRRVLARIFTATERPGPSPTRAEQQLAERVLPDSPDDAVRWNAALMEFGALICQARTPQCERCPISQWCQWRAAGYPSGKTPAPRTQKWEGTDRQMRGKIMAEIRRRGAVPRAEILTYRTSANDPHQAKRALAGLLGDGLVITTPTAVSGQCGPGQSPREILIRFPH